MVDDPASHLAGSAQVIHAPILVTGSTRNVASAVLDELIRAGASGLVGGPGLRRVRALSSAGRRGAARVFAV